MLLKVSGGSGPLCLGIQVSYLPPHSCFHLEGETPTRLPVESHPPAKEIASPPLNAATPPEHPVTHEQTKSQSKRVVGKSVYCLPVVQQGTYMALYP